ncbi:MAG: low molecular weight protein-tyrosine-phosphatase [Gammaproteobacteria bacterium]
MKVLFVCLGNICRSPTAEGVFRSLALEAGAWQAGWIRGIDSAGTGGWHAGEPPDPRTVAAARRRGYDLSTLRARQVTADDFHAFDLLLAMDRRNLHDLSRLRPAVSRAEIRLFLDFAPDCGRDEVPDPYYGGSEGFSEVLDLCESAARGLLAAISGRDAR